MAGASSTERLVAGIYNAAWMVRHYARGGRSSIQQEQRADAIHKLGLAVRDAFAESEDFEALLTAVVDGLSQKEQRF